MSSLQGCREEVEVEGLNLKLKYGEEHDILVSEGMKKWTIKQFKAWLLGRLPPQAEDQEQQEHKLYAVIRNGDEQSEEERILLMDGRTVHSYLDELTRLHKIHLLPE